MEWVLIFIIIDSWGQAGDTLFTREGFTSEKQCYEQMDEILDGAKKTVIVNRDSSMRIADRSKLVKGFCFQDITTK